MRARRVRGRLLYAGERAARDAVLGMRRGRRPPRSPRGHRGVPRDRNGGLTCRAHSGEAPSRSGSSTCPSRCTRRRTAGHELRCSTSAISPVGYKRYNKSNGKGSRVGRHRQGLRAQQGRVRRPERRDFRQANVKATQTIDIRAFVDAGEIPLEYYETPYYLAPAARRQGVRAAARDPQGDGTRRGGRGGAAPRRTSASCIRRGKALMFNTLRYQDELKGRERHRAAARRHEERGDHAEGGRARQAPGRRHDRGGTGQYKNTYHDDHGAHRGEDQGGAGHGDHQAVEGRRRPTLPRR